MSEIQTGSFLIIFFVVLTAIATSSGITNFVPEENLNEYNITEEDLKISPNIPSVETLSVDLEDDAIDPTNVRFDDPSTFSDPDYLTDVAVSHSDTSQNGNVTYRVPSNAEIFETKVTRWGFLQTSGVRVEGYVTPDASNSPIFTEDLKGQQNFNLQDANYIRFVLESGFENATVYDLEYQTGQETGYFATLSAWGSSAGNFVASLISVTTGLPPALSWVSIALLGIATLTAIVILWV